MYTDYLLFIIIIITFTLLLILYFFNSKKSNNILKSKIYSIKKDNILARRINHITFSEIKSNNNYLDLVKLGLKFGNFPLGWKSQELFRDANFTTTGFWLGNIVIETVTWEKNIDSPITWLTLEPNSNDINWVKSILFKKLKYNQMNPKMIPTYSNGHLMYLTVSVKTINWCCSNVQYTFTPSFPGEKHIPPSNQPQGHLGILYVSKIRWSTSLKLNKSISIWEKTLNLKAENNQLLFPNYGNSKGIILEIIEGLTEGISSILVCVEDISKVSEFFPDKDIYNGIDIANCKWYFYQEHQFILY